MNKIDISSWKTFYLTDLFNIGGSTTTPKNKLELSEDGEYPYITTAATNNGVNGYSNVFTDFGNVLTVDSAVLGTTFYQEKNFTASDHVEVLTPKFNMDKNTGLFIASVMNATGRLYGYAYNDKRSQTALKNEKIVLPVDSQGKLNIAFMDSFIEKSKKNVDLKIKNMKKVINNPKKKINIQKWKDFHLYDLFEIDSGSKLDKVQMKTDNPRVNFVGRANANNGVTTKVNLIDGLEPYNAGNLTLSLGGEYLGSCFIQKEPFYTSQNVNVLIPKIEMSLYSKLFISTVIFRKSRLKYKAFIDELNRHVKTDFSFKLPVDMNGKPDWNYMEEYIKSLRFSSKIRS